MACRSAVVVAVPAASAIVDPWRERTCRDRPSIGVPAHVTLLFPFVPASRLDDDVERALAAAVGAVPAFPVAFREPRRFPDTLWLAPEPAEPFVRLTEAIAARFPQHPPYEGAFAEIVPHLTVAHGPPSLLDEAAREVEPALPVSATVAEVLLLEELEPDWGRWRMRRALPLGA